MIQLINIFPYIFLFIISSRLFSQMIPLRGNNIFLPGNALINFSDSADTDTDSADTDTDSADTDTDSDSYSDSYSDDTDTYSDSDDTDTYSDSDDSSSSERNVVESPYPEWFKNPNSTLAEITIIGKNEYTCVFSFRFDPLRQKIVYSYDLNFLPNNTLALLMKILFKDYPSNLKKEGLTYGDQSSSEPNAQFARLLERIDNLDKCPWRFRFPTGRYWPLILTVLFDFIVFEPPWYGQHQGSWKLDTFNISCKETVKCSIMLDNPYSFISFEGIHDYLKILSEKTYADFGNPINKDFSKKDFHLLCELLNAICSSHKWPYRSIIKGSRDNEWEFITNLNVSPIIDDDDDDSPYYSETWGKALTQGWLDKMETKGKIITEIRPRVKYDFKQYLFTVIFLFIITQLGYKIYRLL